MSVHLPWFRWTMLLLPWFVLLRKKRDMSVRISSLSGGSHYSKGRQKNEQQHTRMKWNLRYVCPVPNEKNHRNLSKHWLTGVDGWQFRLSPPSNHVKIGSSREMGDIFFSLESLSLEKLDIEYCSLLLLTRSSRVLVDKLENFTAHELRQPE